MVIGNNLARAFVRVGALSIIQFQTVLKDTAHDFLALAAGIAAGTSNHFLGLAGTGVISGVAFLLHWTNYGSLYKSKFILSLRATCSEGEETPAYSQAIRNFVETLVYCTRRNQEMGKRNLLLTLR